MKKLFLLCSLALLLNGCVAAALVGGATAASIVVYDKRSFKTMSQDKQASVHGQRLINESPILKGSAHISIATFNHIMLMVGQAQTPELRAYAYKLVKDNSKNIQRIYNEVTISGIPSFLQRTNDSWITTKVKTAMLGAKGLHSTQIKVVTEASIVYLLGVVSREQGERAANVARHIPGVRKVVKVFQYT